MPSLLACKSEVFYDAGEFGTIAKHQSGETPDVIANEGYRFLGWSEAEKSGSKEVIRAQYEKREYFINGDLTQGYYEFAQDEYLSSISVRRKTTNLQTNVNTVDGGFGHLISVIDTSDTIAVSGTQFGILSTLILEFDETISIKIDDSEFFSQPIVIEGL